ncbi:DEAD/DEAH box helicase [Oceanihabitans sediminis]|uniref:DEAD-box ATP-dependent RNA helicase RhpA n=1 Tax=Oceanihabitans sediminis TaxID=1812012 RepID=A0A368P4G1_9FLAO|nr:DEAD/DEAH box helicase [Oceanihabitans sediminis]MDX1277823.1 DEAD/DEAH box helicase [Oceanihabitans sediminis]MDX1774368.1 DEAD/DEAH box helicase [Oceanihabitans sediminis]RBP29829.1 ATP-dependent RNA helicase RhlE [Oceanihabitans sediminis]RCU57170.1 DEAD/DEAH box helicase [Oceanihabitans sediminis]
MSFKDLQLNKPLLRAIAEAGYDNPTLVQEKTIPFVLENKDIICSAQTGTGKTAAFALPILQQLFDKQDAPKKGKKIRALIVSPTRELAAQIHENFKTYGKNTNLTSTVIFGGTSIEPQKDVLKKGIDILIATPGRLLDLHKQDCINLDYVETLVLDEADLMLDMGFIDDVKKIERLCPEGKQILLFSATMPFKVEQLANTILKTPERVEVTPTSSAAINVSQVLYYVPKRNKIELCLHLLRNTIKGNILIFRRTKFGVDKLEQTLLKNGYKVDTIHGDKAQNLRQEALNKFKNGYVNILIATDVAARGIDINELDAVVNFDLPNIPETYVHRIGRTGRAGNFGSSYSLCSVDEKSYVKSIEQLINIQIPVEENHPYPLDPKAKPIIHKSKKTGSKHKKGRKSEASKKKKKRWY